MGIFNLLKNGLSNLNQSIGEKLERAGLKDKMTEIEINGQKVKVFSSHEEESTQEKEIKKLSKDGDALYLRGIEVETKDKYESLGYFVAGEEINHPGCIFKLGVVRRTWLLEGNPEMKDDPTLYENFIKTIQKSADLGHQPAIDELKKLGI
jgi:hypothetical protein